jgi:uncharacterized protein YciI
MTSEEAEIMSRHAAYMRPFFDEGRIVVYGPVGDPSGAWGLSVFDAESEDEVRAIVDGDPAVTSGLATCDVFPMLAGYVRDEPPST